MYSQQDYKGTMNKNTKKDKQKHDRRLNFRIPEDEKEAIRKAAAATGYPVAFIARNAIKQSVKQINKQLEQGVRPELITI
jgi:uncharacterized protein (DUF1778 family)